MPASTMSRRTCRAATSCSPSSKPDEADGARGREADQGGVPARRARRRPHEGRATRPLVKANPLEEKAPRVRSAYQVTFFETQAGLQAHSRTGRARDRQGAARPQRAGGLCVASGRHRAFEIGGSGSPRRPGTSRNWTTVAKLLELAFLAGWTLGEPGTCGPGTCLGHVSPGLPSRLLSLSSTMSFSARSLIADRDRRRKT